MESSVEADRIQMKASLRVVSASAYSVHELEQPDGIVVREYVSDAASVFAVSWHGAWRPDLQQILGRYYETFLSANNAARRRRGPVNISSPGLVVQMGGHQRSFTGRAYIPELLPHEIRAEDIR